MEHRLGSRQQPAEGTATGGDLGVGPQVADVDDDDGLRVRTAERVDGRALVERWAPDDRDVDVLPVRLHVRLERPAVAAQEADARRAADAGVGDGVHVDELAFTGERRLQLGALLVGEVTVPGQEAHNRVAVGDELAS